MSDITIDKESGIPKYKQIIESIEDKIEKGIYKKGDKLPSINTLKNAHGISRDTVLLAYNNLKIRGLVQSIAGKGYFLKNTNINVSQKVFLLFDELNAFKEDLYNSLIDNLNSNIVVDPYFHHFNPTFFSSLLHQSLGNYNSYIIMPANLENTYEAISILPKDKVYILDQISPELKKYRAIYQNPEKDIFNKLLDAVQNIRRYQNLILLFDKKQPEGMKNAVLKFCKIAGMPNEIVPSLDDVTPQKGDVYLIPDDKNLVKIIKKIKKERLRVGKDVGLIAINDTLLKEILEDGITTITTNFTKMGRELAKMINSGEYAQIENPMELIKRNSL